MVCEKVKFRLYFISNNYLESVEGGCGGFEVLLKMSPNDPLKASKTLEILSDEASRLHLTIGVEC